MTKQEFVYESARSVSSMLISKHAVKLWDLRRRLSPREVCRRLFGLTLIEA